MKKRLLIFGLVLFLCIQAAPAFAQSNLMAELFPWRYPGYTPPFACAIRFEFEAPEEVQIIPGQMEIVQVIISDVICGLSRASLHLEGIPEDWVEIAPDFYPSIAYVEGEKSYIVQIEVPEDTPLGTYTGMFWIQSSVQDFPDIGQLTVNVVESVQEPGFAFQIKENEFIEPLQRRPEAGVVIEVMQEPRRPGIYFYIFIILDAVLFGFLAGMRSKRKHKP